jgi:hypothetical protein
MKVWLDGNELFDDVQMEIKVGGIKRSFTESAAAGLDGVLRIDLGQRGRAIKQKGTLRAKSKSEIEEVIREIGTYQDGNVHTMKDSEGRSFENVCIDSFTAGEIKASGGGVICEYEIIYSQLKV